jgi:predicted membrane protein
LADHARGPGRAATRKLVLAALFAALGVLLSSFAIPVGGARVYPFQHTLNAVAGVLALMVAFALSSIPGAIIGYLG